MARKKSATKVIEITTLGDGYNRLYHADGIKDKRSGNYYSEVICKTTDNGYFE